MVSAVANAICNGDLSVNTVISMFESPLLPFRSLGLFVLSTTPSSLGCLNDYLAIDSGENVSEDFARNCCVARILAFKRSRVGVGMNRSARG